MKTGYKKNKIIVNCLAFAGYFTLLAPSMDKATYQLSSLNHTVAKVGLLIAINISKFITNIRDATNSVPLEL